jgi:hypothetical protein
MATPIRFAPVLYGKDAENFYYTPFSIPKPKTPKFVKKS